MGPGNQSINHVRLRREKKREKENMFVARNVDIQALAAVMVTAVTEALRQPQGQPQGQPQAQSCQTTPAVTTQLFRYV